MSQELPRTTAGDMPLDVLVVQAEERVRQAAERLSDSGVLGKDPGSADLLVQARALLLVAASRLRVLG